MAGAQESGGALRGAQNRDQVAPIPLTKTLERR